jgi:hypothetical protein
MESYGEWINTAQVISRHLSGWQTARLLTAPDVVLDLRGGERRAVQPSAKSAPEPQMQTSALLSYVHQLSVLLMVLGVLRSVVLLSAVLPAIWSRRPARRRAAREVLCILTNRRNARDSS